MKKETLLILAAHQFSAKASKFDQPVEPESIGIQRLLLFRTMPIARSRLFLWRRRLTPCNYFSFLKFFYFFIHQDIHIYIYIYIYTCLYS